jgi:DNA-binding CsgD family transcriptional regulator
MGRRRPPCPPGWSRTGKRPPVAAALFHPVVEIGQAAYQEGTALSLNEADAYAQRGRGERKRPATGWASLTPAEIRVAELVTDGLSNATIGRRLLCSARTAQAHLTHIYAKLDISSRAELAVQTRQEV